MTSPTRPLLPLVALAATLGTSLSFSGLLTGSWFPLVSLGAVLAVAGAELARRLRAPQVVAPFAGLAVLALYLVARFVPASAGAGVVPTPASFGALRRLAQSGFDDISVYVPPAPASPGILLLLAAGIGLVAILVDTRVVTYGGAGAAAIPLLCLYAVPALVAPEGASAWGFVLGASFYLLMLHLDRRERLRGWGRVVDPTLAGDRGAPSPMASSLGRPVLSVLAFLLVVPVLVAVVIPAAIPALSQGVLASGGDTGNRNRTVHVINPILDLRDNLVRRDVRQLMTYSTSNGAGTYVRIVGLDVFDGDRWDASRLQVRQTQQVNEGMEQTGSPPAPATVTTTMNVGPLQTQWLPLPFPATRVDIDDTWLYDKDTYNVFSTEVSTQGSTYSVDSAPISPSAQQLRGAPAPGPEFQRFLELPADIPDIVTRRSAEIARQKPLAYDRAVEMERWLRGFDYDEQVPDGGTGNNALASFFLAKRGFCVHFASAMAVMARQLGIPARVAVGFLPGTKRADGTYAVTSHDAHAWPELYFAGVGWVPFEPTPAASIPRDRPYAPPTNEPGQPGQPDPPAPEPTADPTEGGVQPPPAPSKSPSAKPKEQKQEQEPALPVSHTLRNRLFLGMAIAAGTLALLLVPWALGLLARRRRWRHAGASPLARGEAAVAQLRADCLDYGFAWELKETPRQFGARLADFLGSDTSHAAAALRLTALAERLRYAPEVGDVGDSGADVMVVRSGLLARATPAQRRLARWLPRSVVGRAGQVLGRVGHLGRGRRPTPAVQGVP